jgi:CRISPR-associated protein Cmr6
MKIVYCKNPTERFKENLVFVTTENNEHRLNFRSFFKTDERGRTRPKQDYDFLKEISGMDIFYAQVNTSNNITNLITMEYRLPNDTAELLKSQNHQSGENFSLYLNKAAHFGKEKFHLVNNGRFLKNFNFSSCRAIIKKLNDRMAKHVSTLHGTNLRTVEVKTAWRLTIGLGGESVYKTDMSLHPVYGFPYLPGSAVKGVVRSWVIREFFDGNETRAMNDSKLFCDIFGCDKNSYYKKARKGKVYFYDVYPDRNVNVKPDVMNPHYQDYYNATSTVPPADYLSPVPVFFLTITDTKFKIHVGGGHKSLGKIGDYQNISQKPDEHVSDKLFEESEIDTSVMDYLYEKIKKALEQHGIGAKTAVGYGKLKSV